MFLRLARPDVSCAVSSWPPAHVCLLSEQTTPGRSCLGPNSPPAPGPTPRRYRDWIAEVYLLGALARCGAASMSLLPSARWCP